LWSDLFQEYNCLLEVGSRKQMLHGIVHQPRLLVPRGRPPVQGIDFPGRKRLLETRSKEIGEKTVVTEPLSLIVQGNHKQVCLI
jgi:hypothetical protein